MLIVKTRFHVWRSGRKLIEGKDFCDSKSASVMKQKFLAIRNTWEWFLRTFACRSALNTKHIAVRKHLPSRPEHLMGRAKGFLTQKIKLQKSKRNAKDTKASEMISSLILALRSSWKRKMFRKLMRNKEEANFSGEVRAICFPLPFH